MNTASHYSSGTARAERELASIFNLQETTTTPSQKSPDAGGQLALRQSRIRAIHEALQAAGGAEDDEARAYVLRMIKALEQLLSMD
jgi:hypothetical protein